MAKGVKTGGREPGTPNRLTKDLRTSLKNIFANEFEKIPELLESLQPKEKIEILIKIMPFVLPKIESVKMQSGEPFTWDLND